MLIINNSEILWLTIYIALWTLAIFWYWRKEKTISSHILILLTYLGYSIVSFYLYIVVYPEYKGLSLFPFIFQFFMVMLALRPVRQYCKYKDIDINVTYADNQAVKLFLRVWVLCSLYAFIQALPHMHEGIFRILTDVYAGQEIYDATMTNASKIGDGTSLGNLPIVLSNVFADVGTLFSFYYICKQKPNKFFVVLLVMSMIAPFFQAIASSQRGPAIDRLYTVAVSYFLLRAYYSDKIKRVAKISAVSIGAFLIVSMTAITMSRFGMQSEDRATESVYQYVGMENLNFNLYAFDNNGLRYGDRTAPFFKRMLGFSDVPQNFMERRAKYPHLKIDDEVFIGFVGDFCLDYGPIISVVLFVMFSTIFCEATRQNRRKLKIHQLILVQFAACVCMCGGMKLFSFADLGNLKIIAVILTYIFFKYNKQVKPVAYKNNR